MLARAYAFGALVLLAAAVPLPAQAGDLGEWGDAPEGVIAYPSLAVTGAFPTCQNVGPAMWVYHGALCWAHFPGGPPPFDFETEGNAGLCPGFAPYDNDECWNTPDGGLLFPPPYTIQAGVVVPCISHGSLGIECYMAVWGTDVDILVVNSMPCVGYANVLMDWNQDGQWGGSSTCPAGQAPEHVLVDWPVPMGFGAPGGAALSLLGPPNFRIGPQPGYVWTRFTISETPVGADWNGAALFEDGETEDYLLRIDADSPVEGSTWGCIKYLYR